MFQKFNTAFEVSFEFFVGECKFKKSQFDKTEYEKLMDKISACIESTCLRFHYTLGHLQLAEKKTLQNAEKYLYKTPKNTIIKL